MMAKPDDYPTEVPLKEVLIPEHSQIVVVNHWDWPFAWLMCGVFVFAAFALWWVGRKKL